jgi:hypothetical protein
MFVGSFETYQPKTFLNTNRQGNLLINGVFVLLLTQQTLFLLCAQQANSSGLRKRANRCSWKNGRSGQLFGTTQLKGFGTHKVLFRQILDALSDSTVGSRCHGAVLGPSLFKCIKNRHIAARFGNNRHLLELLRGKGQDATSGMDENILFARKIPGNELQRGRRLDANIPTNQREHGLKNGLDDERINRPNATSINDTGSERFTLWKAKLLNQFQRVAARKVQRQDGEFVDGRQPLVVRCTNVFHERDHVNGWSSCRENGRIGVLEQRQECIVFHDQCSFMDLNLAHAERGHVLQKLLVNGQQLVQQGATLFLFKTRRKRSKLGQVGNRDGSNHNGRGTIGAQLGNAAFDIGQERGKVGLERFFGIAFWNHVMVVACNPLLHAYVVMMCRDKRRDG